MVEPQRVVVVGVGYVGLPAALLLARAGHEVVGVDVNEDVVSAVNSGQLHIREPKLQALMDQPEVRGRLSAQTMPTGGDVFIIAVPTPLDHRKKVADLGQVIAAVRSIVPYLNRGNLVIVESTIPPLTCREVIRPILEESGFVVGSEVFLAHCPERILPGDVYEELVHNDRVIGGENQQTRDLARAIYEGFVEGRLHDADDRVAELCKLMENTYRDVNIALANELRAVGETLGIDSREAITLANLHPRVHILSPGIGVGGHCLPIDPWFIKEVDPANSRLIFAARLVNDEMPDRIAKLIRVAVKDVTNPRIVAVGATYKPNVDDVRESPAIHIVRRLREDGYQVTHVDPLASGYAYGGSLAAVCEGADCLAVLVEHDTVMTELDGQREAIVAAMRTSRILRF